MSTHVTPEQLDRLRRGTLPPADVTAVGRHATACASCGSAVAEALALESKTRDLRLQIDAGDESEHLPEDALMACADGFDHEHLQECASCRAEVEEMRMLKRSMRPRRRWPLYAAAAAASIAAIAILLSLLGRRPDAVPVPQPPVITQSSPPAPVGYGRAEWDRGVADAKQARAFRVPAIVEQLRPPRSTFRGSSEKDPLELHPNGSIVASTRPRLRWSRLEGATYNVIFQLGDRVIESGRLASLYWTPPRTLERGREYAWQVETTLRGVRALHPQTPAPPARFRVVEQSAIDEIDAARRQYPDDALLHAAILARHGLRDEALAALDSLHRDPALANDLRASLRTWP